MISLLYAAGRLVVTLKNKTYNEQKMLQSFSKLT